MEDPAEWNKTVEAQERLRDEFFFEEPSEESKYGKWRGRNIIGRDCPINGGVYVGGGGREAIVVDDTKQQELMVAYQELIRRKAAKEQRGEVFNNGALGDVFNLTRELLPPDEDAVARIIQGLRSDEKISLGVFISNHAGVCRHQALLAAYLLEKLKIDGHIRGQTSIDRNFVPGRGGHAWVRYTNSTDDIFIIDPAQSFVGRIKEAGKDQWFYERPTDKAQREKTQPHEHAS